MALVAAKVVSPPAMSCTCSTPFSSAQPESMMKRLVKFAGRIGFGPSVTNSTVVSSTARTSVIEVSSSFIAEVSDLARSKLNTTSSAVKSCPPANLTPSRSLKVQTFGSSSFTDHSVASAGSNSPARLRMMSGS